MDDSLKSLSNEQLLNSYVSNHLSLNDRRQNCSLLGEAASTGIEGEIRKVRDEILLRMNHNPLAKLSAIDEILRETLERNTTSSLAGLSTQQLIAAYGVASIALGFRGSIVALTDVDITEDTGCQEIGAKRKSIIKELLTRVKYEGE